MSGEQASISPRDAQKSSITIPAFLRNPYVISVFFLVAWWLVALVLRADGRIHIWADQGDKFTYAFTYFLNPYEGMSGYFSPPWGTVLLWPFELMPFELATFLQGLIYFILLALVIRHFGGAWYMQLIALSSPFALDAILELNIDWIAIIGVLAPASLTPLFLAIKPQAIPGYIFTLTRKQWVRAIIGGCIGLLISFIIWGTHWPLDWIAEFGTRSLAFSTSFAPMSWIPLWLSVLIGLGVLAWGFYKEDDIIKILSGVFFTPYLPTYTVIVPFVFVAIRWPRVAAYLSAAAWMIVLGYFIPLL